MGLKTGQSRYQLLLPDTLRQRAEQAAAADRRKLSDYIRMAIEAACTKAEACLHQSGSLGLQQEIMMISNDRIKDAARALLHRASVKADGSELAQACAQLHTMGLCEFKPAEERPIRFPARYVATIRTQEAL